MNNQPEVKYINFTYSSPDSDMESCIGFNPNGDVNVKFTLTSMRDKLMENVNTLNALLARADDITGLFAIDYGAVAVCVSSKVTMDDMLKNSLVRDGIDGEDSDDITEEDEEESESDHETHSDRLRQMKNLLFTRETKDLSDSDDDSVDTDLIDGPDMAELIGKYEDYIDSEID